jgi:hypothetical protein
MEDKILKECIDIIEIMERVTAGKMKLELTIEQMALIHELAAREMLNRFEG